MSVIFLTIERIRGRGETSNGITLVLASLTTHPGLDAGGFKADY